MLACMLRSMAEADCMRTTHCLSINSPVARFNTKMSCAPDSRSGLDGRPKVAVTGTPLSWGWLSEVVMVVDMWIRRIGDNEIGARGGSLILATLPEPSKCDAPDGVPPYGLIAKMWSVPRTVTTAIHFESADQTIFVTRRRFVELVAFREMRSANRVPSLGPKLEDPNKYPVGASNREQVSDARKGKYTDCLTGSRVVLYNPARLAAGQEGLE
ncbi:unnamed protein product, partial [Rhizoctonia solani]